MTTETIELRLKDLTELRARISLWEEQLERNASSATGSRIEIKEGPGAAPKYPDRMAEEVAHIDRTRGYLAENKPIFDALRAWAECAFKKLPFDMREAMERHYLDGKTWPEVARIMQYSDEDGCKKLRKRAVQHIARTA
jgi:DNA-directed RNA polymerase specialized sigma24 family protein